MNAGASLLGEAELHGLVDGHLEADRRADVLRKLAASAADRALVEAWQEQNDLIRAAFRDVEREALPVALDLAPPRLRCIEGDLGQPLAPIRAPLRQPAPTRRRALAAIAVPLLVVVTMVGAWLMFAQVFSQGGRDDDPQALTPPPAALEAALAARTTTALDGAGLPQMRVPDLSGDGLRLVGVATQPGEPGALVLQYRDAGGGRVVLGLMGAPDTSATPASPVGRTLVWRRGGIAYALGGTLPAERLRKLARSLQDETGQD